MKTIGLILAILSGLLLLIIIGGILWFKVVTRRRRADDNGFRYVYVNDDGSARDLTSEEQKYLQEEFHPNDGNRPYVKLRYESRTPDGHLQGYLKRRQLPQRIAIEPPPRCEAPGDSST
jgi:hypothetical protein